MLDPGWQESVFVNPLDWWTDPTVPQSDPIAGPLISTAKAAASFVDSTLNKVLLGAVFLGAIWIYVNRKQK